MTAERNALALRVDVLGSLDLVVEGRAVSVPGSRRRALLALLALEGGRHVGAQRLVDSLWPDEAPDNALQALYNHVSRLRGHLGPLAGRLERAGTGYRLSLLPDELDVDAVRRITATASDAGSLRAALDLWRGPALEEFGEMPALQAERVGLDELRATVLDQLLEARLAEDDPGLVVDAAAAAEAAPFRERTTLVLVRALARSGRAADALARAAAYRRRLAEETGLDPSPALAAVEQEVAAGEIAPALGSARPVARPDGPLVGRQHDREEVLRLLADNAAVTLTGPAASARRGWPSRWQPSWPTTAGRTWPSCRSPPSTVPPACAPRSRRPWACASAARCGRTTSRPLSHTGVSCSCSTTASTSRTAAGR